MGFLAVAEADKDFGPGALEVHLERDDGCALVHLLGEFQDLGFVGQQDAGALGLVGDEGGGGVGADVDVEELEGRGLGADFDPAVGELDFARADALDLAAHEHDAALEGVFDRVVEAGPAVVDGGELVFVLLHSVQTGGPMGGRIACWFDLGFVDDGVLGEADAFDFDADGVAVLQDHLRVACEADAAGGAGDDERAGEERAALRDGVDERGDVEDHVAGVGVLHLDAVDEGLQAEVLRVFDFAGEGEGLGEWAEGVEGLAAVELAARAVFLPPAGGDVVGGDVAQDAVEGAVEGDVADGAGVLGGGWADDDAELGFEVDLRAVLADLGDDDR